jgi:thiaminase/transcriptional activator TenA
VLKGGSNLAQQPTKETPFTELLWAQIQPLFNTILSHPFIRGLTDGSLQLEQFRFYIVQDALYLREFARSLSIAAAKAPVDEAMIMFNEHAAGALHVEKSLHEGFFKDFGLSDADVRKTPIAPTNLAYTNYLLAVAYTRPFHELLATVLPCYWIYWEVGKVLRAKGSQKPLYQRWINTYGGEEFGKVVQAVLTFTDQITLNLSASEREAMSRHFTTTSRYEWMFWEMGYQQEQWPVTW